MTPEIFQLLLYVALLGGGGLALVCAIGGFAIGRMIGKKS